MFFQAAKEGENRWWQYIVTLLVVFIGWQIIGAIPLLLGVMMTVTDGEDPMEALGRFAETTDFAEIGMNPVVGLILMIVSFGVGIVSLWLMVKYLHKRSFKTLITPWKSVNWSKILTAAAIWFAFMLSFEVVSYFLDPQNYIYQPDWSKFLPLVLVSIFLLPLQTSFEEFLMRGYLMQGVGLATGSRLVALLVPALIFGLMHGMNPEVQEYGFGIMMVNYISIGLMLGVITLMDDGLELALGVHWANNFYGATIVTFSGSALSTPTIFKLVELDIQLMTVVAVLASILFVFLLSKIYGWKDWSKIWGPVENNEIENEIAYK